MFMDKTPGVEAALRPRHTMSSPSMSSHLVAAHRRRLNRCSLGAVHREEMYFFVAFIVVNVFPGIMAKSMTGLRLWFEYSLISYFTHCE